MANNVYAPFGFREMRLWNSSAPNYAVNGRALLYNYGSNIAWGDPVFLNTSGLINLYVVAGTTIDGVAYGGEWFDPNNILSGQFHPAWNQPSLASTAVPIMKVQTDPNMVFMAQANGIALTQAIVGQNIDIFTGSSGTPVSGSGQSQCALDAGNVHTTNTLPFRIVGIIGITPGFGTQGLSVPSGYVPTNGNQLLAVTMNTQDMTTRTGQA